MKSRSGLLLWVFFVFLAAAILAGGAPSFAAPNGTASQEDSAVPAESVALDQVAAEVPEPFYTIRGGLDNARLVFEGTKQGRVAYLGGSITASPGWRDFTYEILKKRFPETAFDFINAGVGGTNSTYGAFRLEQDVFRNGPVDLLFLEFAVNDAGEPNPDNRRVRAMEGIVRHARKVNPKIDILMLHFADTEKIEALQKGRSPDVIEDHEEVADHYGIASLNLAREVSRRLISGDLTWEQFSRDTCHPTEVGHRVYAECIEEVLRIAWSKEVVSSSQPRSYEVPEPIDLDNYENGRFVSIEQPQILEGWKRNPQWTTERTCNYSGPVDVLAAGKPGSSLELDFEGSLIGISAIAGMDAGILDVVIDGGAPQQIDLFDNYCKQFHRPVCRVLAENLPRGKHTLRLTTSSDRNMRSLGHAARILKFVAN